MVGIAALRVPILSPWLRTRVLLTVLMIIWGSGYVVTEYALRYLQPLTFMGIRMLISAVAMTLFIGPTLREARTELSRKDWTIFFVFGGGALTIAMLLFHFGLYYSNAVHSTLIWAGAPAVISLLAFMFDKEVLRARQYLGILLGIGGIAMVGLSGQGGAGSNILLGDAISAIGILAFASYTLAASRFQAVLGTLRLTALVIGMSAILMLPVAIIGFPKALQVFRANSNDALLIFCLVWMAVVHVALGFTMWVTALSRAKASEAAAFMPIEPLVGSLMGVALLNEKLSPVIILGGAALMMSIPLSQWAGSRVALSP